MIAELRRIKDRNIAVVYAAIGLLGLAYGTAIAVIAIYLDQRHYSKEAIGWLAAWFALGVIVLSLPMGALIRRFSAKTVLGTSLLGYATTVSLFPWAAGSFETLSAVRFADGGFSVGIWVSCETILLARSSRETKGLIMGLYAMCMGIGYVVGPLFARALAGAAPLPVAFWSAGVIAAAAGLLALSRLERDRGGQAPVLPEAEEPAAPPATDESAAASASPLGAAQLLRRIKTSCLATFVYGYYEAAVVLFMPLYLHESRGLTREQTIVIPAFFAIGMLSFSGIAGRLGDRFGHLRTMRLLAVAGAAVTALFTVMPSFWFMGAAVLVGGASLASISPVSLALQGVVVSGRDYARANAFYNAFFAAGMLLGPPIASRLFARLGGPAMLFHLAALWAFFVAFTVVFRRDDPGAHRATRPAAPAAPAGPLPDAPRSATG